MKKKIFMVMILLFFFYFFPFDWFICGELNKEFKEKVDDVKKNYGDLVEVQVIPCEYSEINIKLKTFAYSDTLFHSIHNVLYNKNNYIGWTAIVVYDKEGSYLFHHSYTNNFYKKK